MPAKYTTLEHWITEALRDTDKENPCTSFACVYNKPNGGTKEVHAVSLKSKTGDAATLAKLFKGKAEAFAQDLGGIQSFELQAFYGRPEAQATHTFTVVDGELQAAGRARAVRESPDGQGMVAQAMRHVERSYEQLSMLVQANMQITVQREQRWAEREASLQTEVNECYTILREVLMGQIKKDHTMIMAEEESRRQTQERGKLIALLPALANSASGRELFPQPAADSALLDAIAEKVSPELIVQLNQLGVLPPEIVGPLTARLNQTLERRKAEEEAIKKLPPANGDPRKEIGGEAA